jgi:two-component system, LuxR family, sensor kinase FixL
VGLGLLAPSNLSSVTVLFSMMASACLTLAFISGLVWWRDRTSWPNLAFGIAAFSTAGYVWYNLAILKAATIAELDLAVTWSHVAFWLMFLSLAAFVKLYLREGRTWLFWSICGLRTLSLLLSFTTGKNLNYRSVAALHHIPFLGDVVSTPVGIDPNPWMIVGQLSLLGMIAFTVDVAVTVWRRGDRRRAITVAGSIALFTLADGGGTVLVVLGIGHMPPLHSILYLGLILVMAYEVAGEMIRAAQTTRDLRAREQQIGLAATAANLGFWSQDLQGKDIWATDHWRSLFGFTQSEPLHLDNWLQSVHPEDRDLAHRALITESRVAGDRPVEYRVLRSNAAVRWIASSSCIELDRDGRPIRLQGVSMDITQAKKAEVDAVAQRNEVAHLMRAATLGELSSALAHELNQPLAAILSNAQAMELMLNHDKLDWDEIRDIVRDIITDDKHAAEVIKRLRGLLKKGEFTPQSLDANDLVLEVLKLLNYELTARAVRIVSELAVGLPTIRGDRVHLQQVLINLIMNAADAMSRQSGSRTLTIRSSLTSKGLVQYSVQDTGGGIEAGNEEKIFEPYHTTKQHGLGLGLSLSRSIVLAHGGHLWAENQGLGAVLRFTVPPWKGPVRASDFIAGVREATRHDAAAAV